MNAAKRVLIAEDNPDLRDIFTRVFTKYEFQVVAAADGQIAVDSLQTDIPDIVVLDINMPKLNGFDVLARLQHYRQAHNLKVIIVTGNSIAMQDERTQYADLVLIKPVDINDLILFAMRLSQ